MSRFKLMAVLSFLCLAAPTASMAQEFRIGLLEVEGTGEIADAVRTTLGELGGILSAQQLTGFSVVNIEQTATMVATAGGNAGQIAADKTRAENFVAANNVHFFLRSRVENTKVTFYLYDLFTNQQTAGYAINNVSAGGAPRTDALKAALAVVAVQIRAVYRASDASAQLQRQLDECLAQLGQARGSVSAAGGATATELAAKQQEIDRLKARIDELEDQLDAARDGAGEAEDLSEELAEVESARLAAEQRVKELQEFQTRAGRLENQLAQAQEDLAEAQQELQQCGQVEDQAEDLEDQLQDALRAARNAQEELATYKQQAENADQCTEDLVKAQRDLRAALDQVADMREEVEEMKGELAEAEEAVEAYEDLQSENRGLQDKVVDLEGDISKLEDRLRELGDEFEESLEAAEATTGEQIEEFEGTIDELKEKLKETTSELNEMTEKYHSCTENLEKLGVNIAEYEKMIADLEKYRDMAGRLEERLDSIRGVVEREGINSPDLSALLNATEEEKGDALIVLSSMDANRWSERAHPMAFRLSMETREQLYGEMRRKAPLEIILNIVPGLGIGSFVNKRPGLGAMHLAIDLLGGGALALAIVAKKNNSDKVYLQDPTGTAGGAAGVPTNAMFFGAIGTLAFNRLLSVLLAGFGSKKWNRNLSIALGITSVQLQESREAFEDIDWGDGEDSEANQSQEDLAMGAHNRLGFRVGVAYRF